jgi:pimeloyl-ACP methyl ester carboxylesterase
MPERHVVAGHEVEVLRIGGDLGRPTIVLLHEALGCIDLWRDFPDRLADATGCPVVAWSRWGYGGSERRPAPWPFDYHETEATEALPDLIDVLGLGEHVLWGHSDGATIALLNAGLAPGAGLAGVVSVAGHVIVEPIGPAMDEMRRWFDEGDLRDRLGRHHRDPDTVFGEWLRIWSAPEFAGWDIRPKIASRTPTLVLQGAADQYATEGHVQEIVDAVGPGAAGRILGDAGHHPMFDATERLLGETIGFLRAL